VRIRIIQSDRKLIPECNGVTGFIPALDGLRGIAILAVLLFHLGIPQCSLGWAGVELFFVISGFLITRILLKTREDTKYFTNFYYRRTLRIFPIYYMVLIGYTIVALFAPGGGSRTLPFYYIYLQTIPQLHSQFTDLPILSHTWSLAIEEQFYLVWPVAVFLLKGGKLLVAILVMIAAGLILRFLGLGCDNPFLVDGWLGVQLDSLAAGSLVAYSTRVFQRDKIQHRLLIAFLLGTVCLMAIVGSVGTSVFWSPKIWCRAWYGPLVVSAMACAFAGAVGLVAIEHRPMRWLKARFLTGWGKISYGVYLFHPFIFLLVDTFAHDLFPRKTYLVSATIIAAKLSMTYVVALVSWQLVERPISRLKDRTSSGIGEKDGTAQVVVVESRQTASNLLVGRG
jgi:peptidoglycan/LPS O-acetylase OafA/YrhL